MKKKDGSNQVPKRYADAMGYPMLEMILLITFSAMVFDGGLLARIFVLCFSVFWTSVAVIAWRRPGLPSKSDLHYVQMGLLVVVFFGSFLTYWMYTYFEFHGAPGWLESLWEAVFY